MAFPSKTCAADILRVALAKLEGKGAGSGGLSVRGIAAELGVAPNALYHYYPDRDRLLAAAAEEGERLLHETIRDAAQGRRGAAAVRSMAEAYLEFARRRPALYALVMQKPAPPADVPAPPLWTLVIDVVAQVAGPKRAREAATALWGFLHGAVALESAGRFSDEKPRSAIAFGLEALLAGMRQKA
jgi:AcrR family transcriptional regulator